MSRTGVALTELAGYAKRYRTDVFDEVLAEFDVSRERLPNADPRTSLKVFFRLAAFARPDRTQAGFHHTAVSALERTPSGRAADDGRIDPDELWASFLAECERTDTFPNEGTNRALVRATAKLANRKGNLFEWVCREVTNHGRLAILADELVSTTGVETPVARFFIRDAVWLCGAETTVRRPDRHHLQSVTPWVERVAHALWPSLEGANEDVLADKAVTECAAHGVSTIEFNQGGWYFGREEVAGGTDAIDARVREIRC